MFIKRVGELPLRFGFFISRLQVLLPPTTHTYTLSTHLIFPSRFSSLLTLNTMSYEPPKHGCPCWVEIASSDIARGACTLILSCDMQWCTPVNGSIDISPAKQFYSQVFDWNFRPATEDYPAEKIAMFSFPDPKLCMLGGGIVNEPDKIKREGAGVYLYVNSIEEALSVRSLSPLLVAILLHSTYWLMCLLVRKENPRSGGKRNRQERGGGYNGVDPAF